MGKKCELCGKAISAERLEALPETKRCVKCARRRAPILCPPIRDPGWISTPKDLLGAIRS